jgi:hypothetical protein
VSGITVERVGDDVLLTIEDDTANEGDGASITVVLERRTAEVVGRHLLNKAAGRTKTMSDQAIVEGLGL